MKKNKHLLLATFLGIISLVLITSGTTLAFFNYAKQGTTDNSITTGSITFLYTEVSGIGRGISINDAYPVSDSVGKAQTGEGKVFDFKVTSNTMDGSGIPYEITARKKVVENILDEEAVKLYLTKVSGTNEEEVLLDNYSNLTQTTKVDSNKYTEKTLYTDKVPAGITNYEQAYRLRMWIDDSIDFSPVKDEEGNDIYPYNDKEFTITVNVYANAKVLTQDEIEEESTAVIESIQTIDGTKFTELEGQEYDYEVTLPNGTTETTIDIKTNSPNTTVKIEKLDSLETTTKTLQLSSGDNYYKLTVTSENKKVENEFILKISVGNSGTLLSDAIFNTYTTIYENPTLTDSSSVGDASGLYKSVETNSGDPTYYFRGNVTNNYVNFAGFTWRVVRINEDGTIRIVMQDGINDNAMYKFNPTRIGYTYMYYSNSNVENGAKYTLDNWYNTNIASNATYANRVAIGKYFCEEAKVKFSSSDTSGNATMKAYNDTTYTPSFSCSEDDGNQKGIVNASVGLLNYDEVLHAGGYPNKANTNYYLYNPAIRWWTMSPEGVYMVSANAWSVYESGTIDDDPVTIAFSLRPVLILKADTTVTGLGTTDSPWLVQ